MNALVLIDMAVKVAVVGLSLYPLVRPASSHFAGKAMGFRALLYPLVTLLIPLVWLLADRPVPYPVLAEGMSLIGAAAGAIVMATVLWPSPGTPATLSGWVTPR